MTKNQQLLLGVFVLLSAAGITYLVVQQKKKKQGQKEVILDSGEKIIIQTETTDKMKAELDDLHARLPNSKRYTDSLKVPFFRNYYILMYDNGRFYFGRDPQGLYPVKGNWTQKGNILLFDDGRAFRETSLNDNLRNAKNAIFQNIDFFKEVDEYQEYLKRTTGDKSTMTKAKYAKLIELLKKYGAADKFIMAVRERAMKEGFLFV